MSGFTLLPLPKQKCMPIGLRPGKKRFAIDSLAMVASGKGFATLLHADSPANRRIAVARYHQPRGDILVGGHVTRGGAAAVRIEPRRALGPPVHGLRQGPVLGSIRARSVLRVKCRV